MLFGLDGRGILRADVWLIDLGSAWKPMWNLKLKRAVGSDSGSGRALGGTKKPLPVGKWLKRTKKFGEANFPGRGSYIPE